MPYIEGKYGIVVQNNDDSIYDGMGTIKDLSHICLNWNVSLG